MEARLSTDAGAPSQGGGRLAVAAAVSAPPADAWPRWAPLAWLALGAVGAVAFAAFGHLHLSSDPAQSICFFRRMSGVPCPGCGVTRAMVALSRGELALAWELHPLAPFLLLETIGAWLLAGWMVLRRRALPLLTSPWVGQLMLWHGLAFFALWLGRAATGTLPW